jgi:alkanesulfonate monooxygenase SsuD/methylene tetrahydromethanopterin reductase-like flavin-dependent oxidoreductase (luciferase family)
MDFGIFSESGYRTYPSPSQAYEEDLFEITTADRLGFTEAWVAEPNLVRSNTVTNGGLMMAHAAALTKNIKFGSGIRQLPLHHPVNIVQETNSMDQLTRGRYILGYGGTHLVSHEQLDARGVYVGHAETRAMAQESLEFIMKCYECPERFDYDGQYFKGKDVYVNPRPYTLPHPPIAAACSGSAETIQTAAKHGFIPLFGRGQDLPDDVHAWCDTYVKAAEAAGRSPSRKPFHVTHFVYVAETDQKAREDTWPDLGAILDRRKTETPEYLQRRIPPGGTIDDITVDLMLEQGFYWVGTPETVYNFIKGYYDDTGGFGTLLFCAGIPVATPRKRAKAMKLFMEEVAPALQNLDPDREPALAGAR